MGRPQRCSFLSLESRSYRRFRLGSVVEAGESISVVPAREDLGERSAEGPGTGPVFAETAGVGERERGLESRSEHTAEEGRGEEGGEEEE